MSWPSRARRNRRRRDVVFLPQSPFVEVMGVTTIQIVDGPAPALIEVTFNQPINVIPREGLPVFRNLTEAGESTDWGYVVNSTTPGGLSRTNSITVVLSGPANVGDTIEWEQTRVVQSVSGAMLAAGSLEIP